jgi:hypothetical protein
MKVETDVNADASAATAENRLSLQNMSEEDRTKFLEGDDLPEETQEKEKPLNAAKDPKEVKAADEQEPQQEPARRESRAERRIRQLNDKVKTLEAQVAQKPGTETRTSSTSDAKTSKAPIFKSYSVEIGGKYTDWDAAHEAWETDLHAFYATQGKESVSEVVKAEREAQQRAEREAKDTETTKAQAKDFAKRATEHRKTLPQDNFSEHFVEIKESLDEVIGERPEMAEISGVLLESEVGPELITYFGENPDEWDALLDMPLTKALREIGRLEGSDKIKAPTPKTRTAARRIGSRVSGAGASSADPEMEAVEKRDMVGFLKANGVTEVKWGPR